MPRKAKTTEIKSETLSNAEEPAAPVKAAKTPRARRVTPIQKANRTRGKKTGGRRTASSTFRDTGTAAMELSDDTIRVRAYFISERRRRFALPGDAESDWLEARQQLTSEAGRR